MYSLAHPRESGGSGVVKWAGAPVFAGERRNASGDDVVDLERLVHHRVPLGAGGGAAHELGELLRAVAAYAAGGLKALSSLSARNAPGAQKLLAQLK
jgi:hypothetical protein